MRIISKYKDYYDFLVGKYGIDDKVVLDRRQGSYISGGIKSVGKEFYIRERIAFCGMMYYVLFDYKGELIHSKELINHCQWRNKNGEKVLHANIQHSWKEEWMYQTPQPTEINNEEGCPIVLVRGVREQLRQKFPRLKDYRFSSIVSPEDAYIQVYNWLSKQNESDFVDNRTDIEKVQSAGFDKKTSFRH